MRIFLLPQVTRLLRKERLPLDAICRAAYDVVAGRLAAGEADLGDGLFKKRIARPGGGKRGGYRVVIAYRQPRTDRVLFVFAFAKNAAATLTRHGHDALAKAAAAFLVADDRQVGELMASGDVSEVACDGFEQA